MPSGRNRPVVRRQQPRTRGKPPDYPDVQTGTEKKVHGHSTLHACSQRLDQLMEKYLVDLQFLLDEFVKLEILIAPEASHGREVMNTKLKKLQFFTTHVRLTMDRMRAARSGRKPLTILQLKILEEHITTSILPVRERLLRQMQAIGGRRTPQSIQTGANDTCNDNVPFTNLEPAWGGESLERGASRIPSTSSSKINSSESGRWQGSKRKISSDGDCCGSGSGSSSVGILCATDGEQTTVADDLGPDISDGNMGTVDDGVPSGEDERRGSCQPASDHLRLGGDRGSIDGAVDQLTLQRREQLDLLGQLEAEGVFAADYCYSSRDEDFSRDMLPVLKPLYSETISDTPELSDIASVAKAESIGGNSTRVCLVTVKTEQSGVRPTVPVPERPFSEEASHRNDLSSEREMSLAKSVFKGNSSDCMETESRLTSSKKIPLQCSPTSKYGENDAAQLAGEYSSRTDIDAGASVNGSIVPAISMLDSLPTSSASPDISGGNSQTSSVESRFVDSSVVDGFSASTPPLTGSARTSAAASESLHGMGSGACLVEAEEGDTEPAGMATQPPHGKVPQGFQRSEHECTLVEAAHCGSVAVQGAKSSGKEFPVRLLPMPGPFRPSKRRRSCFIPEVMMQPREVRYQCGVCGQSYASTVSGNPWWLLVREVCPTCHKMQIPRVDISNPANNVESHIALLTEHGSDGDCSGMEWDGETSDDNSDDEYSGDEGDSQGLMNGEARDGSSNVATSLDSEQAAKLLVLMCHARDCPGHHHSPRLAEVCRSVKFLMLHLRDCDGRTSTGEDCPMPWCRPCTSLLHHLLQCPDSEQCQVCNPMHLPSPLQGLRALNLGRVHDHAVMLHQDTDAA